MLVVIVEVEVKGTLYQGIKPVNILTVNKVIKKNSRLDWNA